jgi:hypothetical protein
LITASERHGADALVGALEAVSRAGTPDSDIRGLVFGAVDLLDAGRRPDLRLVKQAAAEEAEAERSRRAVEATRREIAKLQSTPQVPGSLPELAPWTPPESTS